MVFRTAGPAWAPDTQISGKIRHDKTPFTSRPLTVLTIAEVEEEVPTETWCCLLTTHKALFRPPIHGLVSGRSGLS